MSTPISDLNCLYICPSLNWGTSERMAIHDAHIFKMMGGHSHLLCLKDSFVEDAAKKSNLEIINLKKKSIGHLFDVGFYFYLKEIIKKNNINLIHCYTYDVINSLVIGIGQFPDIPLVLTVNEQLKKRNKSFLKKILFARIDAIVTYNKTLKNGIEDCLPIKYRKIHAFGAGISFEKDLHPILEEPIWKIACYVPRDLEDLENLFSFLHSIPAFAKSLSELTIKNKKFKVDLITDRSWDNFIIHESLKTEIENLNISDHINFVTSHSLISDFMSYHIYVSIDQSEYITDYEYHLAGLGLPILIPRNAARSDLFENFHGAGENYHVCDAREMKEMLIKIINNYAFYRHKLSEVRPLIQEKHGHLGYQKSFRKLYEDLVEIRRRLIEAS